MDTIVEKLLKCMSRRAKIEFTDGEVVDAVLVSVDPTDHQDIAYEVIRVLVATRIHRYDGSNIYLAPIDTVRDIRPLLPDESTGSE